MQNPSTSSQLAAEILTVVGGVCRTLHTATDAQDTKWIAQQWVACGYQVPSTPGQTFQVLPGLPSFLDDAEKKPGKKAKSKKGARQLAGKGFGAK